ncbi:acylphosphatase [Candidatus Pacearchaeota archaeon]|nr:acylphosphatase [Candidatus Pacearchaeota archaeon]|tara:strand:+ start:1364 stop:1645 length:282 start_codon:yes stop_codon:yes gene_type:complete
MVRKAAKFVIQGSVQGIFFRQFIKEKAELLELKGFTRNLTDGNVEIIVEGDGEKIQTFGNMLKEGPEHASVRNIQFEERKWNGEFKDFKILRF